MASFTVVYDACVLYPAALRDLLMRLAVADLCQPRWTEEILDETFDSLQANRPDLNPDRLAVTRLRMCEAVPECLVRGHEELVSSLKLPDPEDRHVLATAIHCEAQMIVTDNIKDFPEVALKPHHLRALTADRFVLELTRSAPDRVVKVVHQQAAALNNPPSTVETLLNKLVPSFSW